MRQKTPGVKPLDLMNIPARLVLALQADGWYHRSTIIWAKPNPMPESVSGWRWEQHRVKVGNKPSIAFRSTKYTHQGESPDNSDHQDYHPFISEWLPCPGCATCEPHGGLVLRRGSWRPTTAHEYIFMLTKTDTYFCDGEAVREANAPGSGKWGATNGSKTAIGQGGRHGNSSILTAHLSNEEVMDKYYTDGRNMRSVWTFPTMPYSGAVETSHLRRVSVGAVSDDTICIPSPSCRVHEGLLAQVAREFYDAPSNDLLNHIEYICNRLFQEPFVDCAPTDQQRALGYEVQSSGYFPRVYSPAAIDHNNEIHRMALALGSSPAYIPFFEIVSRIADKSRLLVSFVQHLCIYGNSTLLDDVDAHLLDRIPHHIVDTLSFPLSPDCECQYYEYYTKISDHFATYPPELPRRCLKASLSERGCCPACGAAWARIIEREKHPSRDMESQRRLAAEQTGRTDGHIPGPSGMVDNTFTAGWLPTCSCDAGDPVPMTVLDPFCGSGTTGLVARELGAHFIGVDLSYPYLHEQARERLGLAALDAWTQGAGREDGKGDISELPLFKERGT